MGFLYTCNGVTALFVLVEVVGKEKEQTQESWEKAIQLRRTPRHDGFEDMTLLRDLTL